jgi:hypothetical protein
MRNPITGFFGLLGRLFQRGADMVEDPTHALERAYSQQLQALDETRRGQSLARLQFGQRRIGFVGLAGGTVGVGQQHHRLREAGALGEECLERGDRLRGLAVPQIKLSQRELHRQILPTVSERALEMSDGVAAELADGLGRRGPHL